MNLRASRTFQALVLGGLGIYLFSIIIDGQILLYINQRLVILALLAALALIFMAQLILRGQPASSAPEEAPAQPLEDLHSTREGWALWLLALPLLVGLLAPQRPAEVRAARLRGMNTASTYTIPGENTRAVEVPPAQRSVLDWARAVSGVPAPAVFAGQPADVTGFVYHSAGLAEGQFMVGRLVISCCAAHAAASGMVIFWPGASALPDGQWVRVRGTVRMIEMNGIPLAAVEAASVDPVPQPVQPYLFP